MLYYLLVAVYVLVCLLLLVAIAGSVVLARRGRGTPAGGGQ